MRLNIDPFAPAALESTETGDASAARSAVSLDALYRSQAGRLLRLFVRRAGPQDAADLVQETFIRFASARADRDVHPASPERYLSRIAGNLLRDKAKSAPERAANFAMSHEDAGLMAPDQIETLEARDMLNRVEAAMLRLKPMTREIFIAAKFHGLSLAEIAEQTGLTVKGVEKHMTKAYAQLHRLLGQR
ncbi:RNA polymerase sigma factor [Sphingomonas sp. DT-204]|uniref:RNA polymerase sigma factor n=1 Tax=Sphingomonas sp. DT-204 TaxID=3396166 RepID=UPI003F1B2634